MIFGLKSTGKTGEIFFFKTGGIEPYFIIQSVGPYKVR
jgi:hypothetical protein